MSSNGQDAGNEAPGKRKPGCLWWGILGFVFIPFLVGLLMPCRPVGKTGPRITAMQTLHELGKELMFWQEGHDGALPDTLDELDEGFLSEIGSKTNAFLYLGESGIPHDIVVIERPPRKRGFRRHWTDDKLVVLRSDFASWFRPTNTLPPDVLRRLLPPSMEPGPR